MTTSLDLAPVTGPAAWRGDELSGTDSWIHHLTPEEVAELEEVGGRFLDDDPDLRSVVPEDYPLPVCAEHLRLTGQELDRGRGFLLVRGLRTTHYSDALSAAIFFLMGLHLGEPMRQNELGDLLDHIMATSDKTLADPEALGSRVRDKLNFHSDSSDIVALMCLRPSREGGASTLVSGATLYNEVLARRPDLAPLLFEPFHHDWYKQDHDAPQRYYTSPICSWVDGVFSIYGGTRMIFSAQDYPEVPRLTEAQVELLHLLDTIAREPGVALDMDFRPGDVQWLLNYAALHSRTAFLDFPELQRRRHLLRLWLRHDVGRPVVPGFGKNVVQGRTEVRAADQQDDRGNFSITMAAIPRMDWGS
ncbi:TauD/TfdA family dioxygenase [Pseudonocardia pini]|uniref:TauD/TfdA family dioxygenase n=1 Tax=Pseudonocardia pini TaxID=2758030 RepID=UPI0015F0FF44|nr:TauD/TfdA family dioxygenase [Pseudonocardia pini]